jgi:hypothetical protein
MMMYWVASRPVKNCVMPTVAMAVDADDDPPSSF